MTWLREDTPIGRMVAYIRRRSSSARRHRPSHWGPPPAEGWGDPGSAEGGDPDASEDGAPPWGDGRSRWTRKGQNPFLLQRHEFHNRFYDLASAKRNWQIVAFLALGALFVMTVGYVHLASSSRITPYVVEVAALGQARAFGPAERMPASEMDRAVTAELAEFITNARRVVADVGAQREVILEAYAFADAKARTFLNHHYSQEQNDPRFLSQRIRRTISVESILKMPDTDSYKVRWTEREIGLTSAHALRTSWEAILAVRIDPPATEADLLVNPLGVKVYDINWSQIHALEE